MYSLLVYLSYFMILFSCNDNNHKSKIVSVDTTFVNWNKATLLSLNNIIQTTGDSAVKETYENRLLAFKAFVNIENDTAVNVSSIRYQFLEELSKDSRSENFYIIEANHSGESVEIINYVVYIASKGVVDVDVYVFKNTKWVRSRKLPNLTLELDDNLQNQFVGLGLGFNRDDVVITKFNDNNVVNSQYYAYTTLSNKSRFKEILLH